MGPPTTTCKPEPVTTTAPPADIPKPEPVTTPAPPADKTQQPTPETDPETDPETESETEPAPPEPPTTNAPAPAPKRKCGERNPKSIVGGLAFFPSETDPTFNSVAAVFEWPHMCY